MPRDFAAAARRLNGFAIARSTETTHDWSLERLNNAGDVVANHVLLEAATRRRRRTPEIPPQATYEVAKGFWTVDGEALVRRPGMRLGAASSKKNDIETGEDLKGE